VVGFEPRLLCSGRKIPAINKNWKLGGPQGRSDGFGGDINRVLCRGSIVIETRFIFHSVCNLDAEPTALSILSGAWEMNGVGVGEHIA